MRLKRLVTETLIRITILSLQDGSVEAHCSLFLPLSPNLKDLVETSSCCGPAQASKYHKYFISPFSLLLLKPVEPLCPLTWSPLWFFQMFPSNLMVKTYLPAGFLPWSQPQLYGSSQRPDLQGLLSHWKGSFSNHLKAILPPSSSSWC